MLLLFSIFSFISGFAVCLLITGTSEHEQIRKIIELEEENQSLKVKFLNKCWNSKGKENLGQ